MLSRKWQGLLAGVVWLMLGGLQCGCSAGNGSSSAEDSRHAGGDVNRGNCETITAQGCCSGTILVWCDQGQLKEANCSDMAACGWNPMTAGYDCGTDGTADPTGQHPMACTAQRTVDALGGDSSLVDVLAIDGLCSADAQCPEADGANLPDGFDELFDTPGHDQTLHEDSTTDPTSPSSRDSTRVGYHSP